MLLKFGRTFSVLLRDSDIGTARSQRGQFSTQPPPPARSASASQAPVTAAPSRFPEKPSWLSPSSFLLASLRRSLCPISFPTHKNRHRRPGDFVNKTGDPVLATRSNRPSPSSLPVPFLTFFPTTSAEHAELMGRSEKRCCSPDTARESASARLVPPFLRLNRHAGSQYVLGLNAMNLPHGRPFSLSQVQGHARKTC